jgi:glutamine amidotransferase
MITIVDYGLGNVLAFLNVFSRLSIPVTVAKSALELEEATKVILPGVGSFDHAMRQIKHSGMQESITRLVLEKKLPVLGICVGMQMLANASTEGTMAGLGWIDGDVRKFNLTEMPIGNCLPHMGWNTVKPRLDSALFRGIPECAQFYFLHSYYFKCTQETDVLATTEYGGKFACAVRKDNVYGVQFHPEKSHRFGSQLLKNFADI